MNVQIDLNEEDTKLFTAMAKKRDMTLPEFMHYCAMKQAAREYSFIVADEEDLGQHRTIRRQRWQCLFRHLLLADFLIYRQ